MSPTEKVKIMCTVPSSFSCPKFRRAPRTLKVSPITLKMVNVDCHWRIKVASEMPYYKKKCMNDTNLWKTVHDFIAYRTWVNTVVEIGDRTHHRQNCLSHYGDHNVIFKFDEQPADKWELESCQLSKHSGFFNIFPLRFFLC